MERQHWQGTRGTVGRVETWSVSSCWPPPHTISISINTRQSGARDATCVEPQVSFFSLVYCYYTNYYCLQTLHGHHHTSTPTPDGRKGARDATHLGPQVSFHIWYLTQLLFTVAMRPPPFPSPTFIPPSLIPTPDEWTEAWDPVFFLFSLVSFFLCSRTVYYSINIIWLHICPIIYGWIRMYEIAESNYFLNYVLYPLFSLITIFYINSHTLPRFTKMPVFT